MEWRRLMIGILVVGVQVAVAAQPAADPKDALTRELLDLSGTKRQIESFPQIFNASLQPQGFTMTNPVVFELLRQSSARHLSAEGLYKTMYDHVKKSATADELHTALQVVRSPIALKFTAWEVDAAKPEVIAEMQPFMAKLASAPPEPERIQLINAIDEVSGGTDLVLDMNMASFYAAAKAARAAMPKEQQRPDADLQKAGDAFREQAAKAFKEQTLAGMLFVYRNASTDEIKQYLVLLTSPSGKWLMKVLRAGHVLGMNKAMEDVGRDFGEELGKRMAASKASPSAGSAPPK